jgi:hypothetical protein
VAEAAIPHDLVAAELLDVVVDSPRRTGDDAACSESFARCRAASSIGRHGVRRVRWVLWVSSTQGRFFPSEKRVIQDAYGTQAACQDAMTRFRTTATLLLDSGTHAGTPILVPDDMLKSRPPGDDDYQVTFGLWYTQGVIEQYSLPRAGWVSGVHRPLETRPVPTNPRVSTTQQRHGTGL